MKYLYSQHVMIEIIDVCLIGTIRIPFHITIHIVQNVIHCRIRIFILHLACGAQPGVYVPVILPVPVINQQNAVSVRLVISEMILLIKLLRIDPYEFFI